MSRSGDPAGPRAGNSSVRGILIVHDDGEVKVLQTFVKSRMDNSQRIDNVLNIDGKRLILKGMKNLQWLIWLGMAAWFAAGCGSKDREAPDLVVTEPAYDGMDIRFGDIIFVQFEANDDREDGGIWRVELRKEDGVSVRAAQTGMWLGSSTGSLAVPFVLDAPQWPSETMTLAVIADDAAGNRAAVFREMDYVGADDIPAVITCLVDEGNSTAIVQIDAESGASATFADWPEAHAMAYSSGTLALAESNAARVQLIDNATGSPSGEWANETISGTLPLIRQLHRLPPQSGFVIVHAGGITCISESGNLLFERFSEAPWTPIDAQFAQTTCVLWEQNEATGAQRLRSWDFQTGATGPIMSLAMEAQGMAVVTNHDAATNGQIAMISESNGITLCDVTNGSMSDLCGLLGNGTFEGAPADVLSIGNEDVVFARGGWMYRQAIAPVSTGSQWSLPGEFIRNQTASNGSVLMLFDSGASTSLYQWTLESDSPESISSTLPLNTRDVLIVND